ncbi:MAG: DUF1893 domain-containing protein [Sodaliphilus sp.]
MQALIDILNREQCSLVVRHGGQIIIGSKPGVRDLEHLLKHQPELLKGAMVADKVVGKAAAALMVVGGVAQVYAEVLSQKAVPFLREAQIPFTYGTLVDAIQEGAGRCPLEAITAPAFTPNQAVELLFAHFQQMQARRNSNA